MTKNRHYNKYVNNLLILNYVRFLCMNPAFIAVLLPTRYDVLMFDENKKLDFDSAMRLAKDNPDAFEQYRREAIDGLIQRVPARSQERLRRLQWRIDQERNLSGNAMTACVRLYEMMWDSFAGERGLVGHLGHARTLCHTGNRVAAAKASVLQFERH